MNTPSTDNKTRCFGSFPAKPELANYHDQEWGVPVFDDNKLFELLILEGAHAGLSWETVLKKRQGYLARFAGLIPNICAELTDQALEQALLDPGIIRHRLKVFSVRKNAKVFLAIQQEFGGFSDYLWRHVDGQPQKNHFASAAEVPSTSALSDLISKDLKKRGMSFVGSTIIYAYLQGVGVIHDHHQGCWLYKPY